jgi:hypothetical protein
MLQPRLGKQLLPHTPIFIHSPVSIQNWNKAIVDISNGTDSVQKPSLPESLRTANTKRTMIFSNSHT